MQAAWVAGEFRDCNGLSNGLPLSDKVVRLEAFYRAVDNGLVPGIDTTEDNTGQEDSPEDTKKQVKIVAVNGQGGEGGDGGDGGNGGFQGAGGDGGRGGNGGPNGGNGGQGGTGGKGGAGVAGGDGGDGGDSGLFLPSLFNIVDTSGSYISIITERGGAGGGGGNGGQGIRNGKGASGGTVGLRYLGGKGGGGGKGGKGGTNTAGGHGGSGGSGGLGFGLSHISLQGSPAIQREAARIACIQGKKRRRICCLSLTFLFNLVLL